MNYFFGFLILKNFKTMSFIFAKAINLKCSGRGLQKIVPGNTHDKKKCVMTIM